MARGSDSSFASVRTGSREDLRKADGYLDLTIEPTLQVRVVN